MSTAACMAVLGLLVVVFALSLLVIRQSAQATAALEQIARNQSALAQVDRYERACKTIICSLPDIAAAANTARWIKAAGDGEYVPAMEHFRAAVNLRRRA